MDLTACRPIWIMLYRNELSKTMEKMRQKYNTICRSEPTVRVKIINHLFASEILTICDTIGHILEAMVAPGVCVKLLFF